MMSEPDKRRHGIGLGRMIGLLAAMILWPLPVEFCYLSLVPPGAPGTQTLQSENHRNNRARYQPGAIQRIFRTVADEAE